MLGVEVRTMVDVMSSPMTTAKPTRRGRTNTATVLASVCALTVAGCSADITRFDAPAFSLSDGPPPAASYSDGGSVGGSGEQTFSQIEPSSGVSGGSYTPPISRGREIRTAALPESRRYEPPVQLERSTPRDTYQPAPAAPRVYDAAPTRSYDPAASRTSSATGDSITVVRGDTLYGLARRHGVTVNGLKDANGLTSNTLRPGQTLVLPNGARGTPSQRVVTADRAPQPSFDQATVRSDWTGSYTIAPGDSLYTIARRHGVKVAALQSTNGITDPRRLRPGQVLKVPGSDAGTPQTTAAPRRSIAQADVTEDANRRIISAPRVMAPSSPNQPSIINGSGNQRVAALPSSVRSTATDASPTTSRVRTVNVRPPKIEAPKGSVAKLRWPARGKIISRFGPRADGTHNDGVNLAVPIGTDVQAAEDGVVAYAGSELKGYGNLILVRHDNGWVTAYAHNDRLLVKRGDKVKRGSVIAKSGKSGQVDTPQVHFELRQGAKPVDPVPFLERS